MVACSVGGVFLRCWVLDWSDSAGDRGGIPRGGANAEDWASDPAAMMAER